MTATTSSGMMDRTKLGSFSSLALSLSWMLPPGVKCSSRFSAFFRAE